MKAVARYFHTLRYLRPIQIAGRISHRLRKPRADSSPPPPLRRAGEFAAPAPAARSMSGPETFRFLEQEGAAAAAADWNDPARALLWTYNLHYFDDLNAADGAARAGWHQALIARWIAQNPPGQGAGWDPYPLSRRLVNWIKWARRGGSLDAVARASIAVQARWLEQCLEYHLLGNHLFANAKALVFAGLYFEGAEGERFLARGSRIVAAQLHEQVLADGGHFERSPMYHAAALEDLLDLCNMLRAAQRPVPAPWQPLAARMQRWLELMSHPDGEISFFNDAAFGIAPTAGALAAYAARLGFPVVALDEVPLAVLADSGYARLSGGRLTLIADCAPVGPDYLPGHAHADTLSFELSVGAQRMFVNSGTSEYGRGPERDRQRGTAAHNTVVVDGEDSSEVWAGFRVARRARARFVPFTGEGSGVAGRHDGYRRLRGRNDHERRWSLAPQVLNIDDQVSGACRRAEAYFHLHPSVRAARAGDTIELTLPDDTRASLSFQGAAEIDLQVGTWHPRFGVVLPNQRVVARFAGARLGTRLSFG